MNSSRYLVVFLLLFTRFCPRMISSRDHFIPVLSAGMASSKKRGKKCLYAMLREGLFSEGYLRLKFGGLIFGRAYFFYYYYFFFFFFFGGGGGCLLSEFHGSLRKILVLQLSSTIGSFGRTFIPLSMYHFGDAINS